MDITKIAVAIIGLGLVATIAVNGQNVAKVVGSVSTGFSNSISAAEKGK